MSTDYYDNAADLDRLCPLCGGQRTRFRESYSDGDEIVELSTNRQQCKKCGLPCKLWEQVAALTPKPIA